MAAIQVNKTSVDGPSIIINVTFTFTDGSKGTFDVPVFEPQTVQDIVTAVQNRQVSEQRRVDSTAFCANLKPQIDAHFGLPS